MRKLITRLQLASINFNLSLLTGLGKNTELVVIDADPDRRLEGFTHGGVYIDEEKEIKRVAADIELAYGYVVEMEGIKDIIARMHSEELVKRQNEKFLHEIINEDRPQREHPRRHRSKRKRKW